MKKLNFLVITLCVIGLLGSCASNGSTATSASGNNTAVAVVPGATAIASAPVRQVPSSVPDFVKQEIKNVPESDLVAVASSRLRDMGLAKQRAEVLARGELSRQIQATSLSMIRDYAAASEVDPSAELGMTEALNTAVAKQKLNGARVVAYDIVDGATWVVMNLPKNNAVLTVNEIVNQVASERKLAAPRAALDNAEKYAEEQIAKNNAIPLEVVTD